MSLLRGYLPELSRHSAHVARVLAGEEERFSRTLELGGRLLDEVLARSGNEVSAEDAFKLHDTFGFPFELTAEIAEEHGKSVDEAGFARLMDEQRERARSSMATVGFGASELDAGFETDSVGYEQLDVRTQIGALVEGDDGTVRMKLRESPFYAAGGGQVSDHGVIESEAGRAVVEQVVARRTISRSSSGSSTGRCGPRARARSR